MENEATVNKFREMLEARGVSRRSFLGLCGTIAAAAGLSQLTVGDVEQALADTVIGKSKGTSTRSSGPKVRPARMHRVLCPGRRARSGDGGSGDDFLNYNETLSAAAGYSMEEARKQTIEAGNYILVYEGALLKGWDGNALRVAMETGLDIFLRAPNRPMRSWLWAPAPSTAAGWPLILMLPVPWAASST